MDDKNKTSDTQTRKITYVRQPVDEMTNRMLILRESWHELLRNYDRYPCCAIFLLLPSDKEVIRYLSENGNELDLISGSDCLIMVMGNTAVNRPNFKEGFWQEVIAENASEGYSVKVAHFLAIELTEFPCVIFFRGIRDTKHVIVSLTNMSTEQIAEKMRSTFSIIHKATTHQKDVISSLAVYLNLGKVNQKGKAILEKAGNLTEKTIETIMEALIKATIK
jgi:hypothetical protein